MSRDLWDLLPSSRTYGEDRRNTIGGWEMRGGGGGGGGTHVSLGTKEEPRTRNSSITTLQTGHGLLTCSCIDRTGNAVQDRKLFNYSFTDRHGLLTYSLIDRTGNSVQDKELFFHS